MEYKGIAKDAIEGAKRWLTSARINAKAGNYDVAIFSLEMSAEIALKGLLFGLGIDIPKTRSIGDLAIKSVNEDRLLSKKLTQEINRMVRTFNALTSLRSIGGYLFETRTSLQDLKRKYEEYVGETERIVKTCEESIAGRK